MAAGSHAPSELVLITAAGEFTVLYDDVRGVSNGIAVSPDNSTIYHAESGGRAIRVSRFTSLTEVAPVAYWSTQQVTGTPDGLALDADGGLWVAMHGGGCLARFAPDGSVTETLPVPARYVTNLCFAGRYLYITTLDNDLEPARRGSIFRTAAPVAGAPVPEARI
jgi:sugar lactone lactonase YvrE